MIVDSGSPNWLRTKLTGGTEAGRSAFGQYGLPRLLIHVALWVVNNLENGNNVLELHLPPVLQHAIHWPLGHLQS